MADHYQPFPKPINTKALSHTLRIMPEMQKLRKKFLTDIPVGELGMTLQKLIPSDYAFPGIFTMLVTIRAHHRGRIHRPKVHATLEDQLKYIAGHWDDWSYGPGSPYGAPPVEPSDEKKKTLRVARQKRKLAAAEKRAAEENRRMKKIRQREAKEGYKKTSAEQILAGLLG